MKSIISRLLICPACLPKEHPLKTTTRQEADGDIRDGYLECPKCRQRYPIQDGVAVLLPDPSAGPSGGQWRYEEKGVTAQYLWSHFSDWCGDLAADSGAVGWAGLLSAGRSCCLDAGCAVGRISFEMARQGALTIGCDLSSNFIRTARNVMQHRNQSFSLPLEGKLEQQFSLNLPDGWRTDTLEFVVADALRLPFSRSSFDQIASLNLVDRVNYPLAHLYEMNRIARDYDSCFLFADPFSWSEAAAPVERWLGGTSTGTYAGRGIDMVRGLLQGRENLLQPPWKIAAEGSLDWRMRSHINHCEIITSQYLVAER